MMGLKLFDWIVIIVLLVLAVIPDPLDIFDFGLPIMEGATAIVYYLVRRKKQS
jgi:hypothetical protein